MMLPLSMFYPSFIPKNSFSIPLSAFGLRTTTTFISRLLSSESAKAQTCYNKYCSNNQHSQSIWEKRCNNHSHSKRNYNVSV